MKEVWKDVPGYYGEYKVSNLGNVYSCKRYKVLRQNDNGRGHMIVLLSKDGTSKIKSVHRLVAAAFIPNPDGLPIVRHLDEDTHNNRADNLAWCSHKGAIYHTAE